MFKGIITIFLLFSLITTTHFAEKQDSFFPVLGYSDDFGTLYGGYYYKNLNTGGKFTLSATNSDRGYKVKTEFDRVPLSENKLELDGIITLQDWSDFYYGNGNNTKGSAETKIFHRYLTIKTTLRYQLSKFNSVGLFTSFKTREEHLDKQENQRFFSDFSMVQFGFIQQFDTRDYTTNATKGMYFSTTISTYPKQLNTSKQAKSILKWTVDFRYFKPLYNGTFAFKAFIGHNSGKNQNYFQLFKLGGSSLLRGTHINRYNGPSLTALQCEYRFPIYKIVSGSIFIDAGQVSQNPSFSDLHLSKGIGVHVKVGSGSGALRFNKGYSEDYDKFHVSYNHAF